MRSVMSWLGCHCVRGPKTHSPHQTDGRQSSSTLKRNITQFCVAWYWLIGLVRAFSVYVLPLLEYNSVVWSPQSVQDIELVERAQRRFTKRLPGLKSYTYARRLEHLKLPSLELRRLHADLVWCYRIYFNLVDINFDDFSHLVLLLILVATSINCTNCIIGVILVVSFSPSVLWMFGTRCHQA